MQESIAPGAGLRILVELDRPCSLSSCECWRMEWEGRRLGQSLLHAQSSQLGRQREGEGGVSD